MSPEEIRRLADIAISKAHERFLQPPDDIPKHEFVRLDNFPATAIVCAVCGVDSFEHDRE